MADPAHEAADRTIEGLRREFERVYRRAEKEARRALEKHLKKFAEADARMAEMVEKGELSEEDYRHWREVKMLSGDSYRALIDQAARGYADAGAYASAAVGGRLPEVYAENVNYGAYQVESAARVDTAFALQDADTVQRLVTDRASYLPRVDHDVAKDALWNRKLLAEQITQGVMLGESIPKIAARVARVTGQNVAGAARVARTSVTAAECAGRVDSYRRAKSMGIDLKQEWLATLDTRTRRSHRKLDGEKVDVGETFSNGCRYPGDPQAPYGEICNCRCTLIAAVDGVDYSDGKRWSRLPEGMTYDDWKAGKDLDQAEWTKGGKGRAGKKGGTARSKMKAADQRKVPDTALTTERGITSKRHAASGAKVDTELIKGDDYAAKFSRIDLPAEAVKSLHKSAVAMLTHRSGSKLEDLVLVSRSSGKVVARSTAGTVSFETAKNAEVEKAISSHPRGDLIAIHNHPTNLPPTGSDFVSAGYNGYGCGLVALHNGEVYYYEVGDRPFRAESFDGEVENRVKMGMSRYNAIIEVMREYEGSHGIKWKKL